MYLAGGATCYSVAMKTSVLTCLLLAALPAVRAERADSFQPTVIQARESVGSLASKVNTLSGNVEVRRGTLLITSDNGVVTEDAEGYQHVVMTAAPGGQPVLFRQKRDGAANQWFEGQALRLEYDEKTETVDLQVQAQVRRTSDGELTDEVSGERIVYTSVTETYAVQQLPGGAAGGDRRGTMVLQPRKDPLLSPASATAANLSQ